jgi:NADPH:quinone reductase-like Zn-dependent oxidoreductase
MYILNDLTLPEGGLAEYAKADIDQIVKRPVNVSLAEAATIPLSALTAWQALFVRHKLQKGQKLLITAGAGGTGIFAVQFAKSIGAYVVATGSAARSRELLEQFGVDEFIDYKKTSLPEAVQDVDFVLDCVGEKVIDDCLKVVKKGGVVVSIACYDIGQRAAQQGVEGDFFIVKMDADQLKSIIRMIESGTVKPVLDRTFALEQTREAFEAAGQGGGAAHGKFVVSVL